MWAEAVNNLVVLDHINNKCLETLNIMLSAKGTLYIQPVCFIHKLRLNYGFCGFRILALQNLMQGHKYSMTCVLGDDQTPEVYVTPRPNHMHLVETR